MLDENELEQTILSRFPDQKQPYKQEKATQIVLQQAELLSREWAG